MNALILSMALAVLCLEVGHPAYVNGLEVGHPAYVNGLEVGHPADVNGNGAIDLPDYAVFSNEFGAGLNEPLSEQIPYRAADLDAGGAVDWYDFLLLVDALRGPQDPFSRHCDPFEPQDCYDGNACTDEFCDVSACFYSPLSGCCFNDFDCGDFDPCTISCIYPDFLPPFCSTPIRTCCVADGQCDDEDPCNGLETCSVMSNECVSGPPPACEDGNACTVDSCDPARGCVNVDAFPLCSDPFPCTEDLCDPATGDCLFPPKDCDDNDLCTADDCDFFSGCRHIPTPSPECPAPPCEYSLQDCAPDGHPCTSDACSPDGFCRYESITGCCFTGLECSLGQICLDHACCIPSGLACDQDVPCCSGFCGSALGIFQCL